MSGTIKVEFTAHAEEQLIERALDRDQVIAVVRAPEQVVHREGRLPIAQSRIVFQGKPALLRVVFADTGETRLVVTVYPSSIERYWQKEEGRED